MRMGVDRAIAVAAVLSSAMLIMPTAAQAPTLAMLDRLDRGEWVVRFRGSGEQKRLCLRTGRELIQLRHNVPTCSRYVVEDGAGQITVQYSCAGNGYGRTSIRRESGVLAQVESQGIADGKPFEFTAEARRAGPCR